MAGISKLEKEKRAAAAAAAVDPAVQPEAPILPAVPADGAEVAGQPPVEVASQVVAPAVPVAASDKDSITIVVPGNVPQGPQGGTKRTFSKEVHGKDFKEHADNYAKAFNGKVVE